MVRTRGAIFSCANWRTVERKSCSSSESRVSGEAGCDARTESATGIKLPLKWLPVQQGQDDFHFWSLRATGLRNRVGSWLLLKKSCAMLTGVTGARERREAGARFLRAGHGSHAGLSN